MVDLLGKRGVQLPSAKVARHGLFYEAIAGPNNYYLENTWLEPG